MINTDKLLNDAKKAGIDVFEARIASSSKLTVETFNTDIENYTVADSTTFKVRGTVHGKCGVYTSDCADDTVIADAVEAVKQSAEYGNELDPEFFVRSGEYEYEKVDNYSAALESVPPSVIIDVAKKIAKSTLDRDSRIESVGVSLEYERESLRLVNSNGLDIEHTSNILVVSASVKAADGDNVESNSHYAFVSDIFAFDLDGFVNELVENAVRQFGGSSIVSGTYKAVYSPDCVAALMSALKKSFSAFNAEQHISLLENRIGTLVFSPLLTVEQTPVGSEPFCAPFDDEGVPCRNSILIDRGVLTGFVYDLASAKRAGVKSTGNGKLAGANVRPDVGYITVHGGDKTQAELFESVGDGVYITDISGIGTGLNPQSGSYSLQASGFLIKDGKLNRPISLVTVAGNIMTDFADITAVGSDSKLTYYGIKTPSVALSKLAVSGLEK